jgi:hypothetical protein
MKTVDIYADFVKKTRQYFLDLCKYFGAEGATGIEL